MDDKRQEHKQSQLFSHGTIYWFEQSIHEGCCVERFVFVLVEVIDKFEEVIIFLEMTLLFKKPICLDYPHFNLYCGMAFIATTFTKYVIHPALILFLNQLFDLDLIDC